MGLCRLCVVSRESNFDVDNRSGVIFNLSIHTHVSPPAPPLLPVIQEGFNFDVDNRSGVIFNLSDQYLTGSLGALVVGVVPHEVYGVMQKVRAAWAQPDVWVLVGVASH